MIKQSFTAVTCFAMDNNVMKPDLNHECTLESRIIGGVGIEGGIGHCNNY